jgi:hypothetical protein
MQANSTGWQRYQHLLHQSTTYLANCNDITVLLKLSRQLAATRQALPDTVEETWQNDTALPIALRQTELILLLARHYRWPEKVRQLLLIASNCSALCQLMPLATQWPGLQRYPALMAARLLKAGNSNKVLQALLAGCYPVERQIAPWHQNPLSVLLTQVCLLCSSSGQQPVLPLRQQIGSRIALSQSDYELQLLRQLLALLATEAPCDENAPQTESVAAAGCEQAAQTVPRVADVPPLLADSIFDQLINADNRQVALHLSQSAELAAPVLALASRLNRQQQAITDLRLAVNLLGRAQLPYILAEAEIQSWLVQRQHPQQALLLQFTHCMADALQLLLPDQPGEACCRALAICLCAPLWLSEAGYACGLLRRTPTGWQPALDWRNYQLNTHADSAAPVLDALLQHYHLTPWQTAVANWLQQPTTQAATDNRVLSLQLAWHSSLVLFANQPDTTLAPLISAAQRQKLLKQQSSAWLLELASHSRCYCPLMLNL